jgi:ligand-binding SRPBCC domain-containing protein
MVERSFGDITDEEMLAAAVRSDQIIQDRFPAITWEHSHVCVDEDSGITTYCVYDAPSPEAVREHASALGGHTIKRIHEIADDVTPMEVRRRAGVV